MHIIANVKITQRNAPTGVVLKELHVKSSISILGKSVPLQKLAASLSMLVVKFVGLKHISE